MPCPVQYFRTNQVLDFDLGPEDYVEFLDGEELSSPVLARMTKDSVMPVVISTEHAIRIYLYTIHPVDRKGFQFSYIEGSFRYSVNTQGLCHVCFNTMGT